MLKRLNTIALLLAIFLGPSVLGSPLACLGHLLWRAGTLNRFACPPHLAGIWMPNVWWRNVGSAEQPHYMGRAKMAYGHLWLHETPEKFQVQIVPAAQSVLQIGNQVKIVSSPEALRQIQSRLARAREVVPDLRIRTKEDVVWADFERTRGGALFEDFVGQMVKIFAGRNDGP